MSTGVEPTPETVKISILDRGVQRVIKVVMAENVVKSRVLR